MFLIESFEDLELIFLLPYTHLTHTIPAMGGPIVRGMLQKPSKKPMA